MNGRVSLSFPPAERLVLGYHSLYDRLVSLKIKKSTSSFPSGYFPSRFHKRYSSLKCFYTLFHPNFSSSYPRLSMRRELLLPVSLFLEKSFSCFCYHESLPSWFYNLLCPHQHLSLKELHLITHLSKTNPQVDPDCTVKDVL